MTNLQAKEKMKEYLKAHFIKYRKDIENGVSRYSILFEGYDSCPELLNKLSVPIFFVLLGEINAEQAISMIKTEILGESEPA